MPTLLLRDPLAPNEIKLLREEFPQFIIQMPTEAISEAEWSEVEILYSKTLGAEELERAHRLRWIHVPSADTQGLCLGKIHEATNLLVTATKSPDVHQMAEFAMGALLASAKDLFFWHEKRGDPPAIWESPHRDLTWSIKGRTLLQIGLGPAGLAIADYATRLGMRVWGVADQKTFHPYCHKSFSMAELNSLLPSADVVSITPPVKGIDRDLLELMREGSILLLLGLEGIDEHALIEVIQSGKFRHVILDAPPILSHKSPLWNLPTVTVTPAVAPCPETETRLEFHQFQYNLRRYIHTDYDRMKNHV